MSDQVRRDLEFRKAFQSPPGLVCPTLQPKLTNILEEHLVWDEQELTNFSQGIECEGSKVFRRRGSDEEVVASARFPLQVGLPFKMDPGMLQVVCFAKENISQRELVYSNVHFLPKLPSTNPKPPPESKVPGVLILLIESLSSRVRQKCPKCMESTIPSWILFQWPHTMSEHFLESMADH